MDYVELLKSHKLDGAFKSVLAKVLDVDDGQLNKFFAGYLSGVKQANCIAYTAFANNVVRPAPAEHYKLIQFLRTHRIGSMLHNTLSKLVADTQQSYETTVANEQTRLQLLAYRKLYNALFVLSPENI